MASLFSHDASFGLGDGYHNGIHLGISNVAWREQYWMEGVKNLFTMDMDSVFIRGKRFGKGKYFQFRLYCNVVGIVFIGVEISRVR